MTEKIEQLAGQTTKIEADLQKYLDFIKEPELTEAERRDFQEKLEKWNQSGNVEQIRTAGVDQEINKNDYLKRHQLLSSEFLTKSIIDKGVKLNINFKNNNLAEWRVGLADMLPPNVKRVKLTRADGTEVIGVRAQNPKTKRIGYYEEIALKEGNYDYMACHTGDSCEPLETYEIPNANLGDLTTYKEHIQLYTNGAAKESSSAPEEKQYYNPETDSGKTPEEIKDNRVSALVEQARQKRQKIGQEVAPSSNETEAAIRKKIVSAAEKRANKFDPAFRTADVGGGSLACAKVVTTILKEAGFLDELNLSVDNTVSILKKKGWQQSTEKAQPGDIVVWDVLPGGKHKHIGVAISKTEAVNNKNAEKMPVASSLYDYRVGNNLRPVLFVLKPPIPKVPGKSADAETKNRTSSSVSQPKSVDRRGTGNRLEPLPRSEVAVTYTNGKVNMSVMINDNRHNLERMKVDPNKLNQIKKYLNHFDRYRSRYEYVAAKTGVPAIAILCIHRMEASLTFDSYLHNGDKFKVYDKIKKEKVASPTRKVPPGIFFDEGPMQWERAAINALGGDMPDDHGKPADKYPQNNRKACSLTKDSRDIAAMLALLEPYNGLGYRNKRQVSPYIYGGTNVYEKGLYVRDGVYDPNAVYKGVGAAAILEVYFNRDKYGV